MAGTCRQKRPGTGLDGDVQLDEIILRKHATVTDAGEHVRYIEKNRQLPLFCPGMEEGDRKIEW